MANEISLRYQTGRTLYFTVHNETSGFIWNLSGGTGGAFEAFVSGNWANYAISLAEQGVSAYYTGNFPSTIQPGVYAIDARQQAGATAAQTDTGVAAGDFNWNGSAVAPLSDAATSGQLGQFVPMRLARDQMIQNFMIYLKSSSDHLTAFVSGTVSGQISKDGGVFGPLQSGAFTETGLGFYALQALTSGDLHCNTCALVFTATNPNGGTSDPLPMAFTLQRTSGYK